MSLGNIVQLQLDRNIDKANEEEFLALLDEFTGRGWHLSYQATARNYAPRVFSCSRDKRKVYEETMRRLLKQQRIRAIIYGRASQHLTRITRPEAEIIDFPGKVVSAK